MLHRDEIDPFRLGQNKAIGLIRCLRPQASGTNKTAPSAHLASCSMDYGHWCLLHTDIMKCTGFVM